MELPPCLRCGWCCKEAPCVHGEGTPCKYLVEDGDSYACGVLLQALPEDREGLEIDLFIGDGCCRAYNPDRARKESQ